MISAICTAISNPTNKMDKEMKNTIKNTYPSLITDEQVAELLSKNYEWFESKKEQAKRIIHAEISATLDDLYDLYLKTKQLIDCFSQDNVGVKAQKVLAERLQSIEWSIKKIKEIKENHWELKK